MEEWNKYRFDIYKENRDVFLTHVITPSKLKNQKFDIFIYLVKHRTKDLSDVDHAEFFFGPKWKNKIFNCRNDGGFVGVLTAAYGEFLCTCCVTFKDGYQVYLSRYIDFEAENSLK